MKKLYIITSRVIDITKLSVGDLMVRMEIGIELFDKVTLIAYVSKVSKPLRYKSSRFNFILIPLKLIEKDKSATTIYSQLLNFVVRSIITFIYMSLEVLNDLIKGTRVLIHSEEQFPAGFISTLIGILFKVPITIYIRGSIIRSLYSTLDVPDTLKGILLKVVDIVEKIVFRYSTKLVAVARCLVPRSFVDKTEIIAPGVNLRTTILCLSNNAAYLRKELGLEGKFVLVYAGRLSLEKGVDRLPLILVMVSRKIPNAHLLIIGDGPLRTKLAEIFERLGLSNNVTFVGAVPRSSIPLLLALADIVVLPSRTEGLPVIALESLACIKPFIGFKVGCIDEVIINRKTGLLADPDNVKQLAELILELYMKPKLRYNLAIMGYEVVKKFYNEESHTRKFLALWKQLLNMFYESNNARGY